MIPLSYSVFIFWFYNVANIISVKSFKATASFQGLKFCAQQAYSKIHLTAKSILQQNV